MKHTHQCLVFALFALLVSHFAVAGRSAPGGWQHIKDISDPHLQDIAKWGVTEYDRVFHKGLEFQSLISGEQRSDDVDGTTYHLIISVKDELASVVKYQEFINESPKKDRDLISFHPYN